LEDSTPSITPVESKRAYIQIVEQVVSLTRAGEFRPGAKLPAERELARRFGVGRPTLREALSALAMLGYVETRPGHGTFIAEEAPSPAPDEPWSEEEGPFTILEAREAIEPGLAAAAAGHRSNAGLAGLEEALTAMERDLSDESGLARLDRQFHLLVAQATQNSVMSDVGAHIYRLMSQELWLAMQRELNALYPRRWELALREHRSVYDAIAARDRRRASSRMRQHLRSVRRVMLEAELTPSS
jgi:GntR family transcriptional repressor for pyruvate dehydrogenase complex